MDTTHKNKEILIGIALHSSSKFAVIINCSKGIFSCYHQQVVLKFYKRSWLHRNNSFFCSVIRYLAWQLSTWSQFIMSISVFVATATAFLVSVGIRNTFQVTKAYLTLPYLKCVWKRLVARPQCFASLKIHKVTPIESTAGIDSYVERPYREK